MHFLHRCPSGKDVKDRPRKNTKLPQIETLVVEGMSVISQNRMVWIASVLESNLFGYAVHRCVFIEVHFTPNLVIFDFTYDGDSVRSGNGNVAIRITSFLNRTNRRISAA